MKRLLTLLFSLMLLCSFAQTARVQVIHNAPDPAADTVNVYIDNTPLLTDFAFRSASPFVDAPAGTSFRVSIMPQGVTDTAQAVFQQDFTLMNNETYVIIASGLIDTTGPKVNNFFSLEVFAGARETAMSPGSPEILVHHGSPDAPAVDVEEVGVGAGTIINNLEYPNYTGYTNFMLADYVLQVKDSTSSVTVGEFQAPLQTLNLGDSAFVLMASGFLNNINNPGPSFGLFAVMPNGQVIELPQNTAPVQVIHNSPDPAASSVAVWVNTNKVLDSVPFRFASPYLPVPANADVDVSITPAGATDLSNAVLTKSFNLMAGTPYVVVATGVTNNPALFDSIQPLDLAASPARMMANMAGNTDVLVYHGATDAGGVSVDELTVPVNGLIPSLRYGEFSPYAELATMDYELAVNSLASGNAVASYGAPLSTLGLMDSSIVVLASGLVNNVKGTDTLPAFGLYAALPTGGALVPLPVLSGIGIEEENPGNFAIYPIPSNGLVNLNTNGLEAGEATLRLTNLQGQLIKEMLLEVNGQGTIELDFSEQATGAYMLNLIDSSGRRYVQKITLE